MEQFRNRLKKYAEIVQKKVWKKKYFDRKKFADTFLLFISQTVATVQI